MIKYAPVVIILTEITYSILAYFDIDCSIINQIGGFSLFNLAILYLASHVFRFCYLYVMTLVFITIVNLLAMYDSYFGIPLSDLAMLRIYLVILGFALLTFLKFKATNAKHNKRTLA